MIARLNPLPREDEAKGGAEHPCQRRIEDEAWFAGSVVGAGRPVRIEEAMAPTRRRIEPRGEMEVEVVAARGFADEVGGCGDDGG